MKVGFQETGFTVGITFAEGWRQTQTLRLHNGTSGRLLATELTFTGDLSVQF